MLKETWNAFLQTDPSEKEVRAFLLSRLVDDFEIAEEVSGTHMMSGRSLRLDAVITLRDNKDISFGIELKRLETARQPVTVLSQVSAYVNTAWNGFGRLPIFICPDPFDPEVIAPSEWQDEAHTAAFRLIDTIMIGGVRFSNKSGTTLFGRGGNAWSKENGLTSYGKTISCPRNREPVDLNRGLMITPHESTGSHFRYRFPVHYVDGKKVVRKDVSAQTEEELMQKIESYKIEVGVAA